MADLTVRQVAERLNVDRTTITRWINAGHFPHAYKLNPRSPNSPFRVPNTDVEQFERERRLQVTARMQKTTQDPKRLSNL
jgi:excisionase family DNA binding protein